MTTDVRHGYEAAHEGCVLIDRSDVAKLWVAGRDRFDLLHRMSTNDMLHMGQNEGRATVLTTSLGRIVDFIVTLNLGKRALILGSKGRAPEVSDWLARHIFFQDKVVITDATGELGQFGLYGAKAGAVADNLVTGSTKLPIYHSLPTGDSRLVRVPDLAGGGFEVIGPRSEIDSLVAEVKRFGAVTASSHLYDLLRVEEGMPGVDCEISGKYIPLEVGLWDAVSFNKGCYIGQEIIARMESRGKLAKKIIGLRSESELPIGATLRTQEGGGRGIVTSSVHSPRLGWIAIGLLKPDFAEPGTRLTVERNGHLLPVTVTSLPFGN